ncbi:MAG TPA: UDP-N-acetylmuramoyl-L-alanine--D-glutamate ligase [Clostridiaceae bacterium]|nr:UDP-N-acetylmuramoyl-L-alanine--D-glutamate ligase [Clostridiaceae bacterium]
MKATLSQFEDFLIDKKIAVIGAGISNRPLIRWLYPKNGNITVFDMMKGDDERLRRIQSDFKHDGIDLHWSTGDRYLDELTGYDLIFRTPRMRTDLPELVRERKRGAVVTSEIALFMELCPAPLYGITGSDGKTTTTTLISLILQEAGYCVYTGGNIGTPLLDQIEKIRSTDRVVLELSSFQLMDSLPVVNHAVITNIIPNHLDFHRDFPEYIDAKKNIFRSQGVTDTLTLNANDDVSSRFIGEPSGRTRFFNAKDLGNDVTAWRGAGALYMRRSPCSQPETIIQEKDVLLPGSFNLDNVMAAAVTTADDVTLDAVRAVAKTFKGVAHRMELVGEHDGVRWYNSSVDSSPSRTMKTLAAFRERNERPVLIAGGQDKDSDYTGLGAAIVSTTSKIILAGQNADLIEDIIRREADVAAVDIGSLTLIRVDNYEQAVNEARKLASPGDSVLLSPAGTSYDKFHHFEERGNYFRRLVHDL